MAEGYVARLPARVTPLRGREYAQQGKAVAAGLGQLAGTVGQITADQRETQDRIDANDTEIAAIEKRRAQQVAVAAGLGRMADMEMELADELQALPERLAPGAAGYEAATAKLVRDKEAAFIDALGDDEEVRLRFAPQVREWANRQIVAAGAFERAETLKHAGESVDKLSTLRANQLAAAPDPNAVVRSLEEFEPLIAAMGLPASDAAKFRDGVARKLYGSMLDGMSAAGQHEQVGAMIASGHLDDVLDPDERRARLAQVENGRRIAQREAEAAQDEAARAAKDKLDTIRVLIDNDQPVPLADIQAAIAAGKAVNLDPAYLAEMAFLTERQQNRQSFGRMATPVLEQQIDRLRQLGEAGRLTPEEARALTAGEAVLKGRDDKAGATLGPMLKAGGEARMRGVAQLASLAPGERWRAAREAGDTRAAVIASLATANARDRALRGEAILRDRRKDFLPEKTATIKDPEAEVLRQFQTVLGPDLSRDIVGHKDLMETALAIMANSGHGWSTHDFGRAVQVVAGMTERAPGVTQGGIGRVQGRRVQLPPLWRQEELDRALARDALKGAIYADGSAARPADVRRNYRLRFDGEVRVGPARELVGYRYYLLDGSGRALHRKAGDRAEPYPFIVPEKP